MLVVYPQPHILGSLYRYFVTKICCKWFPLILGFLMSLCCFYVGIQKDWETGCQLLLSSLQTKLSFSPPFYKFFFFFLLKLKYLVVLKSHLNPCLSICTYLDLFKALHLISLIYRSVLLPVPCCFYTIFNIIVKVYLVSGPFLLYIFSQDCIFRYLWIFYPKEKLDYIYWSL